MSIAVGVKKIAPRNRSNFAVFGGFAILQQKAGADFSRGLPFGGDLLAAFQTARHLHPRRVGFSRHGQWPAHHALQLRSLRVVIGQQVLLVLHVPRQKLHAVARFVHDEPDSANRCIMCDASGSTCRRTAKLLMPFDVVYNCLRLRSLEPHPPHGEDQMSSQHKIFVITCGLLLVVACLRAADTGQRVDETSKRLISTAEKAYADAIQQLSTGRLADPEKCFVWSRRIMNAEIRARNNDLTAPYHAAQAHQKRMTHLHEIWGKLVKAGQGTEESLSAIEYYRAEASADVSDASRGTAITN